MPPVLPQEYRERLIVALDFPNASQAHRLVQQLGDSVSFYKVGLQLFTAEGPGIARDLVASGHKVFLDLKFHDIPNTVAKAPVPGQGGDNLAGSARPRGGRPVRRDR